MMRGVAVSMGPGTKLSQRARCPSWKIHTRAPYEALIERKFISTALMGNTIEPSSRNSTT